MENGCENEEAVHAGVDWKLVHMNHLCVFIALNYFMGLLILCCVISCAGVETILVFVST